MIIYSDRFIKFISWFMKPTAITLWPFIILSPTRLKEIAQKERLDKDSFEIELLRHEYIHFRQQKELLVIGFYVLYLYYFLKNLIKWRSSYIAYHRIPFEREAYANQGSIFYIVERKRFAWRNYVS